MREIVIVIRDLYLQPELTASSVASSDQAASPGVTAPAIDRLVRFGDRRTLPDGWRAWTARWLGLPQYADAAPARVAAADLAGVPPKGTVWLATPVHLIAGLTSLHFDRRSILRLTDAELETLADSFRDTFCGSGFDLRPLGGELLLIGPEMSPPATTTEPARMLLTSVAESLPVGAGARALRQLSAEIEMWLHAHPLNEERARRGALTVATLWIWGGGASAISPAAPARAEMMDVGFGSDPYVRGLLRLAEGETRPMPLDWAAVIVAPRVQRALAVVEVAELLHANESWRVADAVADIDRRLISPALDALRRGKLDRLVLLANDRCCSLRRANRWRPWRYLRSRRGVLEGLA